MSLIGCFGNGNVLVIFFVRIDFSLAGECFGQKTVQEKTLRYLIYHFEFLIVFKSLHAFVITDSFAQRPLR